MISRQISRKIASSHRLSQLRFTKIGVRLKNFIEKHFSWLVHMIDPRTIRPNAMTCMSDRPENGQIGRENELIQKLAALDLNDKRRVRETEQFVGQVSQDGAFRMIDDEQRLPKLLPLCEYVRNSGVDLCDSLTTQKFKRRVECFGEHKLDRQKINLGRVAQKVLNRSTAQIIVQGMSIMICQP